MKSSIGFKKIDFRSESISWERSENTHRGLHFSLNPGGGVRTDGQGGYFDLVSRNWCFSIYLLS